MSKKKRNRFAMNDSPSPQKQKSPSIIRQDITAIHAGPLPPAEALEHYERVLEGCANRIVTMAEKEQDYRHSTTRKALDGNFHYASYGQWFAFIIAIAGIGVAGWVVYSGQPWGATIALTSIVSLAGLFLERRDDRKKTNGKEEKTKVE